MGENFLVALEFLVFFLPTRVRSAVVTNVETKAGGRDVVGGRGWRSSMCRDGCPSLFDVACSESGGLSEWHRAAILAHSRHCSRCRFSLAELNEARSEILGATPDARLLQSRRAAEEIADLLRHRMH